MKQRLAQLILDSLLKARKSTRMRRVLTFFLNRLRQLLVWMGDPMVDYDLCGTHLVLPLSYNLPFFREMFPCYSTNVGRIAEHVHRKYPSLKLVDIGANIGDTVAILRYYADYPILCVEGSPRHFEMLETNMAKLEHVYRSNSFAGHLNGSLDAALTIGRGTARLTNGDSKISVRKLGSILADFPGFENTKMIKVDTDGMDGLILRGASDVIEKTHPVIFFEYDPFFLKQRGDDGLTLFADLHRLGYQTALVYDNFGDYMLSLALSDVDLLEELHLYCLGRKDARYYDICVFHDDDSDLARTVRSNEVALFYSLKRGNDRGNPG